MSAYGIFVLILTLAYVIYFATIITLDTLESRRKIKGLSSEETFKVTSDIDESVEVHEHENGFTVGKVADDSSPIVDTSSVETTPPSPSMSLKEDSQLSQLQNPHEEATPAHQVSSEEVDDDIMELSNSLDVIDHFLAMENALDQERYKQQLKNQNNGYSSSECRREITAEQLVSLISSDSIPAESYGEYDDIEIYNDPDSETVAEDETEMEYRDRL